GAHIAYFATDAGGASLTLDGKQIAPGDGHGEPTQLLAALDDGRPAFMQKAKDGRTQLVVGPYVSAPYDSIGYPAVWHGARVTASLQHGPEWEVLVGERSVHPQGTPASQVAFTADGAHFYFTAYRGDLPERRYDIVIDGVAHPLPP